MNGFGKQLLAGTAFAGNRNYGTGFDNFLGKGNEVFDGRTLSYKIVKSNVQRS